MGSLDLHSAMTGGEVMNGWDYILLTVISEREVPKVK
jgi:hypothetical protein